MILHSFRPHCALAFITAELSFADDHKCEKFLKSLSADTFVEPTPAQAAAQLASNSSLKKDSKKDPSSLASSAEPAYERRWDTKAALPAVLAAMNRHKKVDVSARMTVDARLAPKRVH